MARDFARHASCFTCAVVARSAVLPSRRPAGMERECRAARAGGAPGGTSLRAAAYASTPPVFVAIEWFLLTLLGAVALALATG